MLESELIEASAPCRIDAGGTLDIRTFYYPLRHLSPCTFNIAIDLRTHIRLLPFKNGMVKVSSKGFQSAAFPLEKAPFRHPLGLIFAIAVYFQAAGIHIEIESTSPPQSALGGSSAAAVALVSALARLHTRMGRPALNKKEIVQLAHGVEESVAGVPCGLQDQLAAAYGGVNLWYWPEAINQPLFRKMTVLAKRACKKLEPHLLLAYGGVPHASKDINQKWIEQFLSGKNRKLWMEIVTHTKNFGDSLKKGDLKSTIKSMNFEMAIRRKMTPEVLDKMGGRLVVSAVENHCGAKFTGAGGGGCVWAFGGIEDIEKLKPKWEAILASRKGARLLSTKVDTKGVLCTGVKT